MFITICFIKKYYLIIFINRVLAFWALASSRNMQGRGIILSNSFSIQDTVKLINILIIKYRLNCSLIFKIINLIFIFIVLQLILY